MPLLVPTPIRLTHLHYIYSPLKGKILPLSIAPNYFKGVEDFA